MVISRLGQKVTIQSVLGSLTSLTMFYIDSGRKGQALLFLIGGTLRTLTSRWTDDWNGVARNCKCRGFCQEESSNTHIDWKKSVRTDEPINYRTFAVDATPTIPAGARKRVLKIQKDIAMAGEK